MSLIVQIFTFGQNGDTKLVIQLLCRLADFIAIKMKLKKNFDWFFQTTVGEKLPRKKCITSFVHLSKMKLKFYNLSLSLKHC